MARIHPYVFASRSTRRQNDASWGGAAIQGLRNGMERIIVVLVENRLVFTVYFAPVFVILLGGR